METKEKSFVIRFSLTAAIPDARFEEDDFEEDEWLAEWERAIKPQLIRAIFTTLRAFPRWGTRIRNRGLSSLDEIEIVVERNFSGSDNSE